jgi:hypothetical protein
VKDCGRGLDFGMGVDIALDIPSEVFRVSLRLPLLKIYSPKRSKESS